MIHAKIFKKGGKISGFSIFGHSDEITCAKVSTISQAAYFSFLDHLRRDFFAEVGDGKLVFKLKNSPDSLTEAVFQMLLLGIGNLNDVKLVVENEDGASRSELPNYGGENSGGNERTGERF